MKILPIFLPHLGCPYGCIYCNQKTITGVQKPQVENIKNLIHNFCKKNHGLDKEIAFFGGTFTNLPKRTQHFYFGLVKPYLDKNTAIRISTRPDEINQNILELCKKKGVQTIELGIQSFDDDILKSAKRIYKSETAISSCKSIQQNDFQLGIQLMPGLPGFCSQSLQKTIQTTIDIHPDFVRIYPAIVLKNTELEILYNQGLYKPLNLDEAIRISAEMVKKFTNANISVIKTGLHSDIEPDQIVAGPYHQSFGELVRAEIYFEQIAAAFQAKTLCISSADISLIKGFNASMLNRLKTKLHIDRLPVYIDKKLPKGKFLFTDISPQDYW